MQQHYTCFADFPQIDELADIDLVLDGNGAHETEKQPSPDSLAPDPAEAVAFVQRHFRPGPDGHFGGHILLWTKNPVTGEKISTWFRTLPEFQGFVETQASNLSNLDVYVGMAVSSHDARKGKDLTRYNRLSEETAASITSLWQDLDTTTGHAGDARGYFKDLDALLAAVPALPLPPTELVYSGNGVQAYWRLAEKLEIEPDRQSVVDLLKKWEEKVKQSLAPVTVDSVADLARVLRLPGFPNNKDRCNPKPVRSLMYDGPTYTVAEIEALLPEGPPRRPTQARSRAKTSNRGPAARPVTDGMTGEDWVRHAATCENVPGFEAKWNAIWSWNRPDLAKQSGSEYDMCLAHLLVTVRWGEPEDKNEGGEWDIGPIRRALIERRCEAQRAGWEDVKDKHFGYYQQTIGKAVKADEERRKGIGPDTERGGGNGTRQGAGEGGRNGTGHAATAAPKKDEKKPSQKEVADGAVKALIAKLAGEGRLIYWLDRFYEHRGSWQFQSPKAIEKKLRDAAAAALKTKHPIIATSTERAWMKALMLGVQPPCEDTAILHESERWGSYHLDTGEALAGTAFANVVVSVDEIGNVVTRDPSIREFFALARPYNYPSADPGRPSQFDSWLAEKFPDRDTRQALWECIGGTVLQRLAGDERVVFLKGPGGTGKGTLARVTDALMGLGQTWEVTTPARLVTSPFALSQAPWSSVLRITDMPKMPSREGAARENFLAGMGVLKSMSGSDGVAVEEKNQAQTTARTNLSIWVDTNHSVTLAISGEDHTAWARRVILIPTTIKTPEHRQQRRLYERFLPELPQIAWAAVRAYAATVQGGFTRSLEMVEAIEAERGDLGAAQREALTELTKGYIESLPKGAAFRAYRDDLRDQLGAVLGEKPDEKTLKFMYAEIRGLPGVTETRSGSNRFFCGIGLSGDRPASTPEESAQNAKKRTLRGL